MLEKRRENNFEKRCYLSRQFSFRVGIKVTAGQSKTGTECHSQKEEIFHFLVCDQCLR